MWLTPDEALEPQRALKLLNVTQRTLQDMRGFASARAAYEHALALRGVALHFPRPARGRDGQRFIIEDHPAYDEVAHLDPDGRGDLRCELLPGDVTRLSPRLWRVAGAQHNAYLVHDPDGGDWLAYAVDAGDDVQRQALRATAGSSPRTSGHGAPGQVLRPGPGTTLRAMAGGWLLEEERILVGAGPAPAGADWLAPDRGFLRRCPGG